jgi:hypothetical protein
MSMKNFFWWTRVLSIGLMTACAAGHVASAADGLSLLAGKKGVWTNISDGLLADFAGRDIKPIIKFAYDSSNNAGVCGILADRNLPASWVIVQGQGVFQPASGATPFQRIDGGSYDAFWETAGPDMDPEGRGVCLFSIQGGKTTTTCAFTRDGGKTWRALATDSAAFGYNMGAVDWSAGGEMTMLAQKHHSSDLVLSRDSGQTWTLLGKGESRCQALGVIGPDVLLKGLSGSGDAAGLFRSTDGGSNWVKVADCGFPGHLGHVVVFKGTAYLTTRRGILASHDKGEHWALTGEDYSGLVGPVMFGEDEKHLMVYGNQGFSESKDGGQTWSLAVPFGDDRAMRAGRFESGFWDPKTDSFYLTHISGRAYVYQR